MDKDEFDEQVERLLPARLFYRDVDMREAIAVVAAALRELASGRKSHETKTTKR